MHFFKISFFLRKDRANEDGTWPVFVDITLDGTRKRIGAAGVAVLPSEWDNIHFVVTAKTGKARQQNHILRTIESELMQIFRKNEYCDNLSADLIKDRYLNKSAKSDAEITFLEYFDTFIQDKSDIVGINLVRSTLSRYKFVRRLFEDFLRIKLKRRNILLNDLTKEIILKFEKYLRVDKEYDKSNTVMKKMSVLRTVVTSAHAIGKLKINPFYGYKIKYEASDRGYLTEKEIKALMNKEITIPRLEMVRDVFVFCCFTGLAFIDADNLRAEHIIELDGKLWLIKRREKTSVTSTVLLLDIPLEILKKYADMGMEGRLLPMVSHQRTNSYLKELADICGIEKNITFHMARHTFATLSISKGVPMESVSKMLGHSRMSTTQLYARITNQKIANDMSDLSKKLSSFSSSTIKKSKPGTATVKSHKIVRSTKDTATTPEQESRPKGKRGRPPKSSAA